jgi:branched-subunit amino acid aminotransferase/4-amino-4-deoxychorismate lyase
MTEVWIDGRFVPGEGAAVPSLTGPEAGLFETVLVRDGAPVLLDAHLDRLIASARAAPALTPPHRSALAAACRELPGRAGLSRGRMRITRVRDRTAVSCEPFDGYDEALYRRGAVAALAGAAGHPLADRAGHKVLPYTPLLEAREHARREGAIEVIFHAADGALLEGSASNVFVVADGVIATPPLSRRILPGVVRGAVLDLAGRQGLEIAERDVWIRELPGVEEAFLTGSLMEVLPLVRVGEVDIRLGPLARRLLAALR